MQINHIVWNTQDCFPLVSEHVKEPIRKAVANGISISIILIVEIIVTCVLIIKLSRAQSKRRIEPVGPFPVQGHPSQKALAYRPLTPASLSSSVAWPSPKYVNQITIQNNNKQAMIPILCLCSIALNKW